MRRVLPRRRLVSTPSVDARLVLESFAARRTRAVRSRKVQRVPMTFLPPRYRDRTCISYIMSIAKLSLLEHAV